MKVDINKEVVNLRGSPLEMSFPEKSDLDKLPKDEAGNPDRKHLPRETVGNMLINCLAGYQVQGNKEVFKVYNLGIKIINAQKTGELEIDEDEQKTFREIIEKSLYQEKGEDRSKTSVGIYRAFGIAQLLRAIGIES